MTSKELQIKYDPIQNEFLFTQFSRFNGWRPVRSTELSLYQKPFMDFKIYSSYHLTVSNIIVVKLEIDAAKPQSYQVNNNWNQLLFLSIRAIIQYIWIPVVGHDTVLGTGHLIPAFRQIVWR